MATSKCCEFSFDTVSLLPFCFAITSGKPTGDAAEIAEIRLYEVARFHWRGWPERTGQDDLARAHPLAPSGYLARKPIGGSQRMTETGAAASLGNDRAVAGEHGLHGRELE